MSASNVTLTELELDRESRMPFLSDAEIGKLCEPLVSAAAQRRYLASLGLVVKAKPNGKPLVARAELERVLVGRAPAEVSRPSSEPNRAAWLQVIRGGKRGSQTQGR